MFSLFSCQDAPSQTNIEKIIPKLSCGLILHGENEQQIRYKTSSVVQYTFCEYEQQTRTCNNGTLNNWIGTFKFESCTVDTSSSFSSCGLIAHNETEKRIRYDFSKLLDNKSCEEETQNRACRHGVFSKWSGTFQNKTCKPLPDITINSFEYKGGFRLSGEVFGNTTYSSLSYSPGVIAYNPTNHSLFVVGHPNEQAIAEFAIPEIINSRNIEDFKVQENIIQNSGDFHQTSRVNTGIDQRFRITGLALIEGKLVVNYMDWYDTSAGKIDTTVIFQEFNNLSTSEITGPFQISGAMHAAGWITFIPKGIQASLGGRFISGFSSGGILSRLSVGPSAFIYKDESSILDTEAGAVIQNEALLDFNYPKKILYDKSIYGENNIIQDDILYNADFRNKLWTRNSGASHGFIVPRSNTYVTLGYSAGHESGLGYKIVQDDGNKCAGPCPYVASERYNYYWLWHISDLLKVKKGLLKPHELRPYEYGKFNTPSNAELRGASYDAKSGLLYVSLKNGDTTARYSRPPLFYVYKINN